MGPRNNVINKLKIIWKLKVRALFRKMNPIQPETFEYNWVGPEKLHERHTKGDTRRGAHRSLAPSLEFEEEFHSLFHCPKHSIPREKFYNQIQQNFVDLNQLSYTELIIKLMNTQNFSVNSHLLKFVSSCNDSRTNLLSNHADDT